jgi:hypothetical protein
LSQEIFHQNCCFILSKCGAQKVAKICDNSKALAQETKYLLLDAVTSGNLFSFHVLLRSTLFFPSML